MTYAFIIVVTVAITLKLLFMSFSLYITLKSRDTEGVQGSSDSTDKAKKSLVISWKNLQKALLPKVFYCPESTDKTFSNRL